LLVVGPALAADVVVHVAPTGDDTGDGSRAKPVASLIGARDAVRRLRAEGKAGPVRVVVAGGTYRFAEPLVLTPEDSGSFKAPVCYEAAPGAKPVLSGGRRITGFRALENGLWVADVPAVAAGQWYFEQLWVDGRRARRGMEPAQIRRAQRGAVVDPPPTPSLRREGSGRDERGNSYMSKTTFD